LLTRRLAAWQTLGQALFAPRADSRMRAAVACLVVLTVVLHLVVIGASSGAAYDIASYQLQAATVFHGQNVYLVPALDGRYPYPPVWIWLIAAMQQLAWWLHLPFVWAAKLPALAGDAGLCMLLYAYMRQRLGGRWAALIPALLYAVNPVVLLISAGHGQFDALVLVFVLLALVLRGPDADRNVTWVALALGVAIALKGYPALALPYLMLTAPRGARLLTGVLACVPLALAMLLYSALFGFTPDMVTRLVHYRSTFDFGWSGLYTSAVNQVLAHHWVKQAQVVFLAAYAAIVPALLFRRQPAAAVVSIFLVFYATTPTMSVQYLIWAMPFLCLALPVGAILYTLVALVGALSYYNLQPGALPALAPLRQLVGHLWSLRTDTVAALIALPALLAVYLIAARLHSLPDRQGMS
jgi:Gpi18-like mannosyltransferase